MSRIKPLLILAVGFRVSGCEFSVRDQVLLLKLAQSVPAPGEPSPTPLSGRELQCSEFGVFAIVRTSPSSRFFYVLDRASAFHRWHTTGRTGRADPTDALTAYFLSYRARDAWNIWSGFGRDPFAETLSIDVGATSQLTWSPVRLLGQADYRRAVDEPVPGNKEQFLRLACLEQIMTYLAVNGYHRAEVVSEKFGQFGANMDTVQVYIRLRKTGGITDIELAVPINPVMPPFAGRAELVSPVR